MSVNVDWSTEMPAEVRAIIEPLINRHKHRAPTWLHELWLYWHNDGTAALETRCRYEYRHGSIAVCGDFVSMNPADRELAVMHEFIHFHVRPLQVRAEELAAFAYSTDEKGHALAKDHARIAVETVVTDLARMLADALAEVNEPALHAEFARVFEGNGRP